ncbi:uncharacterized protein LOC123554540 isoform X2 [Mercenaria mercenaria]|nr:uncharacterized protein LOC123554540 isoform X2 [Mercenaria mercenaria]XP_053388879.1 uncharacterized protein LOC123554540 isoform X2 [Mercenaria mercenaria]
MEHKRSDWDTCEKLALLMFTVSTLLIIIIIAVETSSRAGSSNDLLSEKLFPSVLYDQNITMESEIITDNTNTSTAKKNGKPSEVSKRTSLEQRTKTVKMGKEETLLILRPYLAHTTEWRDILKHVKQNIDQLPQATKKLYRTASAKQLRDRMTTQFEKLINQQAEKIEDKDIRSAVQDIQMMERILGKSKPSQPKKT